MMLNNITLESLSNDLICDLFEFFDAFILLRAFSGLNSRFNSLLYTYFRSYRVNYRSMSKEDFHTFNSTYLSLIKDRTIYLRLSDDEDTPFQCNALRSLGITFDQFNNLRSLTFYELHWKSNLNQHFFAELHLLQQLTNLKFVECRLYETVKEDFQGVIDQIWNLPNLKYLYWDVSFQNGHFLIPNSGSNSLRNLFIAKNDLYSYEFPRLFEKTPQLRKFSMSLHSNEYDDIRLRHEFIPLPQHFYIRKLTLLRMRTQRVLINLFRLLPNITFLKVELVSISWDGNKWKEVITNYLPKLKHLHFKNYCDLDCSVDKKRNDKLVAEYINTYNNSFWIEQHQCYVRCHWTVFRDSIHLTVYSLPCEFEYIAFLAGNYNYRIKSTCSSTMHFSYDNLRDTVYKKPLFNKKELSNVRLSNVEDLSIDDPIDHKFFSIFTNFNNLFALHVEIPVEKYLDQIQTILDHAPRLFVLGFRRWSHSTIPPYRLTSSSIRRLDVQGFDSSGRRYQFGEQECTELIQSSLGHQCRILVIEVNAPLCILQLLYCMDNLRTLHATLRCPDRASEGRLFEMIERYLPESWTITQYTCGYFILQS